MYVLMKICLFGPDVTDRMRSSRVECGRGWRRKRGRQQNSCGQTHGQRRALKKADRVTARVKGGSRRPINRRPRPRRLRRVRSPHRNSNSSRSRCSRVDDAVRNGGRPIESNKLYCRATLRCINISRDFVAAARRRRRGG